MKFIYLVKDGYCETRFKLGSTQNIKNRLKSIRSLWPDVVLIRLWIIPLQTEGLGSLLAKQHPQWAETAMLHKAKELFGEQYSREIFGINCWWDDKNDTLQKLDRYARELGLREQPTSS